MTPTTVACLLLAAVVALEAVVTWALLVRVRALQALVMASRDAAAFDLPSLGDPIGPFEAEGEGGEVFTDASIGDGVTLVGFFTAGCAPCEVVKKQLLASPPALPLVAFVDGSTEDAAATRLLGDALRAVARVAYADGESAVHRAFRASAYPTLVRVEHGRVAAAGHKLADVLP